MYIKSRFRKLYNTAVLFIAAAAVIFCFPAGSASAAEVPEAVYSGISNADVVLKNLDYTDIKNSNVWSKEAIYEAGALDIIKGFGNRQFGRTYSLTKEEAIAVAYRMAGREADAQLAAETLDNARAADSKKTDAISMWSDGYLQLAANDGLISQQDLTDAFNDDQTGLAPESFHRNAPASRQEMAFWLAKTLQLQPVYGQQKIFNSYNDWKSADPIKVPYIEAVLQNNIMTGDSGYFRPLQNVTREQAAQIVKNAESVILPVLKLEKKTGIIESIDGSRDLSNGTDMVKNTFNVRNSNGKLHQIGVELLPGQADSNRNEQNGKSLSPAEKNLVVYKNGTIGDSSLLETGDRIEYITGADNTVRYVNVISNENEVRYIAAQIENVDKENMLLNVSQLFNMDYPDMDTAKKSVTFDLSSEQPQASYRYSSGISVTIDGKKSDINNLKPGLIAILTVQTDGIVTAAETVDLWSNPEEGNIVKGIVEENNPDLGYITLYNEDGTGTSPDLQQQLAVFRTYTYINPNDVEVYKNHQKAKIDEIETGDTVFAKLDDDSNVLEVSAADNYSVKYGRVISKRPEALVVEYDDGTQQVLDIDDTVLIIEDKKLTDYDSLKDGDRIKLILNINGRFTKAKEITIEGSEHFVTNIYKGTVSYIDDMSDKLVILNLQTLENGQWTRTLQKGFTNIRLAEQCSIYSNNKETDVGNINKYLRENEAYIAVEEDYGGQERAVVVSFRNEKDSEVVYNDTVSKASYGAGKFNLESGQNDIMLDTGSIVVKDGRLVGGNSISTDDAAYVVANRDYGNGSYNAGVVQINDRTDTGSNRIYRARIKSIDENRQFTVESFSCLNGLVWEYSNTPKTFNITYDTRILGDAGLVNQRDFVGYGGDSYIGRVVYIVADDVNAILVSTAPYGIYNAKGEILEVTGGTIGEEGTVLQEPTGFSMYRAKIYDLSQHLWVDSKDMTINILQNSIILKGDKVIKPSELKKGDSVRVIKKENSETGDAYIVLVENT